VSSHVGGGTHRTLGWRGMKSKDRSKRKGASSSQSLFLLKEKKKKVSKSITKQARLGELQKIREGKSVGGGCQMGGFIDSRERKGGRDQGKNGKRPHNDIKRGASLCKK